MRLRFAKLNPTGNTTILILDPVPVPEQARIAAALMESSVLGGEQVGFVAPPCEQGLKGTEGRRGPGCGIAASLRMMGGEFCGNASRALGAYLAYKRHPVLGWEGEGRVARGFIRVSGAPEPVGIEARLDEDAMPCWAACAFPGPFRVAFYSWDGESLTKNADRELGSACDESGAGLRTPRVGAHARVGAEVKPAARASITPLQASPSCARRGSVAVVSLPGITHIVVDADEWAPREDVFFRLTSMLGLEQDPCVGIMFCYGRDGGRGRGGWGRQDRDGEDKRDYEAQSEGPCERAVPLVHVRAAGSTVWESSCASGAVAVALARWVATSRPGRFASMQPGGVLYVTVELAHRPWAGEAPMVRLEGEVKVVAEGEVFL